MFGKVWQNLNQIWINLGLSCLIGLKRPQDTLKIASIRLNWAYLSQLGPKLAPSWTQVGAMLEPFPHPMGSSALPGATQTAPDTPAHAPRPARQGLAPLKTTFGPPKPMWSPPGHNCPPQGLPTPQPPPPRPGGWGVAYIYVYIYIYLYTHTYIYI